MIYIICILSIILIFLLIQNKVQRNNLNKQNQLIENEYKKLKQEKKDQLTSELNDLITKNKELLNKVNELEYSCNLIQRDIDQKKEFNNSLLKIREDELNTLMKAKEDTARLHVKENVEKYYQQQKEKINKAITEAEEDYQLKKQELEQQLGDLLVQVYNFKAQRDSINEELMRQRQIEEDKAFYKMNISDLDKKDIEILKNASLHLSKPDAVNKIIWTGYYQKPLADLRKRLLPKGDISGVYKITRLKTGEIYIGQTVSIDKRWQDHVKSAIGVGTLASSQLHRVMAEDGPENFTFEVLEETPKEKLRERESFYIDFYDSKNYGLNSVRGDRNDD